VDWISANSRKKLMMDPWVCGGVIPADMQIIPQRLLSTSVRDLPKPSWLQLTAPQ
jgi:hypothetical protein